MDYVPPYELYTFKWDHFVDTLKNEYCSADRVKRNPRVEYLYDYLAHSDLDAKSILVENCYIDGDYLEDFASYYVRCFAHYRKRCRRIHFFSEGLSDDEIRGLLEADDSLAELELKLQRTYLGFIVARPLPEAIVGRTVLKTYGPDGNRRVFDAVRNYEVNLFGTPLLVANSLAFQEQDRVVAACATAALWCAFHKLSIDFGISAPRPAAITDAATRTMHPVRAVPSKGLSLDQMIDAIQYVGLESDLYDLESSDPKKKKFDLMSFVYGYLNMGLPVLLGLQVEKIERHITTTIGHHAVTVVGYAKQTVPDGVPSYGPLRTTANEINKLYVQDDQIGPFSKLVWDASSFATRDVSFVRDYQGENYRYTPILACVPIYNKVRVSYADAMASVTCIHKCLILAGHNESDLTWDLVLNTTNRYKTRMRESNLVAKDIRADLLGNQLPRFIWQARCYYSGQQVLELLLDATDMARSAPYQILWNNVSVRIAVESTILNVPAYVSHLHKLMPSDILDLLEASRGKQVARREAFVNAKV